MIQPNFKFHQKLPESFKQFDSVRKEFQSFAESKAKVIASIDRDNYKKVIAEETAEILSVKPQTMAENLQKITNPLFDLSSEFVDKMAKSENPLVQEIGKTITANEKLNPENVKTVFNDVLDLSAQKADELKTDVQSEIVKNIVKEKVAAAVVKPKNLWEKFKDFCLKVYQNFVKIFK